MNSWRNSPKTFGGSKRISGEISREMPWELSGKFMYHFTWWYLLENSWTNIPIIILEVISCRIPTWISGEISRRILGAITDENFRKKSLMNLEWATCGIPDEITGEISEIVVVYLRKPLKILCKKSCRYIPGVYLRAVSGTIFGGTSGEIA